MEFSWKDIPGFEGHYMVSDDGHVMSLKNGKNRILSRVIDPSSGYLVVCLRKDDKQRNYSVHRLVAVAFIGPISNGLVVCHNNGDKFDNRVSNLRIATQKDNCDDRRVHGNTLEGEKHPQSKLTVKKVLEIRELKANGISRKTIASNYGVSIGAVKDILCRRSWSHV